MWPHLTFQPHLRTLCLSLDTCPFLDASMCLTPSHLRAFAHAMFLECSSSSPSFLLFISLQPLPAQEAFLTARRVWALHDSLPAPTNLSLFNPSVYNYLSVWWFDSRLLSVKLHAPLEQRLTSSDCILWCPRCWSQHLEWGWSSGIICWINKCHRPQLWSQSCNCHLCVF